MQIRGFPWRRRKPQHLGGIVVRPGLDRLPIARAAIAHHQRSGDDRLPDAGICSRYEDAAHNASTKESMIRSDRFTLIEILSRAVPGGTVGGRIARTSKPSR